MGRPRLPDSERREAKATVRCTPEERAAWEAAAAALGTTMAAEARRAWDRLVRRREREAR